MPDEAADHRPKGEQGFFSLPVEDDAEELLGSAAIMPLVSVVADGSESP